MNQTASSGIFIREMWPCKNVCMCYDDKICTLADVMTRDQVFTVLEEGDVDHNDIE